MNRNPISIALFATATLALATLNPVYAQAGSTECLPPISLATSLAPNCSTLVGAWAVTVSPDGFPSFQAYNVFNVDGNSTEFDNSNPPGLQSIAVGPWKKTGDRQFAMLEINQLFDNQGNFAGTLTVKASITLAGSGDKFTSKFTFTVLDPSGSSVFQGTGTASGKRIGLE